MLKIKIFFKNLKTKLKPQLIVPIIVSMVLFMEFLDITIINTAIPKIANDFLISPILLKFAVTSYFLSLAIFIPISGWCADKFGTKKMFIFAVTLFAIASLLCGIAQNVWQLTIFRFLQGIGGAFMNPVSRMVVLRLFPTKDLVRIQGVIFTPAMLGYVLGPFLGGVIVSYLGWHWIFFINLPIALVAIYFGWYYIEQNLEEQSPPFDWGGFILAALALICITFSIEMLNHYDLIAKWLVYAGGILGIALFGLLVLYCLKFVRPVLDFSLLKVKTFRIGFSVNISLYALNTGVAFLLPLMYQESFHLTPLNSGVLTLPIAVGFFTFRMVASRIISRLGFRRVLNYALWSAFIWLILIAQIRPTTSLLYIIIVEFMFGGSTIMIGSSTGALSYVDINKERISQATAIDLTFRQFASSLGVGLCAFSLTGLADYWQMNLFAPSGEIFHYTFYLISCLIILALFSSIQLTATDGEHVLRK